MIQRSTTCVLRLGRRFYADGARVPEAAVTADTAHPAVDRVAGESARAPLADLHGRRHNYLRISLTERCNLRCQYCMPAEGVQLSPREALLSREELLRLTRVFAGLGVNKVRLTGGEPTLRKDLPDIIRGLMEIEGIESVSMTTNGLVLTRQLVELQRAGLAAINVSLDSLRPERYQNMSRRKGLSRVLAGIDLALQLGYKPVKINTVLMKGFNDDEICDFVEFTKDRHVEVRFIEFMPFSGNKWDDSMMVPYRTALRAVTAWHPDLLACVPRANDTARVWQVPGHAGSVGFISSMTHQFCSSCNRLRLTADGNLKVCLFGAAEVSLRDAVRGGASDASLASLVRAALRRKLPQHAARGPSSVEWSGRLQARGPSSVEWSGRLQARGYCTLSHVDGAGRARMVDVGDKPVSRRQAAAGCTLHVSRRVLQLLRERRLDKGDALTVATVAGTLAAKRTADLIPLCHALPLDCVRVHLDVPAPDEDEGEGEGEGGAVRVRCEVSTRGRTGAEMEALVGAALAALALYDMCKAADKNMRVTDLQVLAKTGGKSDYPPPPPPRPTEPEPRVRDLDESPVSPKETYSPSNFINF